MTQRWKGGRKKDRGRYIVRGLEGREREREREGKRERDGESIHGNSLVSISYYEFTA